MLAMRGVARRCTPRRPRDEPSSARNTSISVDVGEAWMCSGRMGFPADEAIAKALLDLLEKRGGSSKSHELAEALAKRLKLTEADLARRISHSSRRHGESAWKQRLRRVRHELVQNGKLARSAERGVWQLPRR